MAVVTWGHVRVLDTVRVAFAPPPRTARQHLAEWAGGTSPPRPRTAVDTDGGTDQVFGLVTFRFRHWRSVAQLIVFFEDRPAAVRYAREHGISLYVVAGICLDTNGTFARPWRLAP